MTPELNAAVARLERLLGGSGAGWPEMTASDAAALRLVLDAVTPREVGHLVVDPSPCGLEDRWEVHVLGLDRRVFAIVVGYGKEKCLARARAVAQVAAREVGRG